MDMMRLVRVVRRFEEDTPSAMIQVGMYKRKSCSWCFRHLFPHHQFIVLIPYAFLKSVLTTTTSMLRSTFAAFVVAAGLVSAQNSTSNGTAVCAKGLQMFVARGTGEDPGVGETGKLVEAIADEIEGSVIEAIDYPAEFLEVNYFLSVSNGTKAVKESLGSYAEACPGHKMAFFGYSQGAQVVSNNLCGQPYVWALAGGSLDASATPKNLTEDSKFISCYEGESVLRFRSPRHCPARRPYTQQGLIIQPWNRRRQFSMFYNPLELE